MNRSMGCAVRAPAIPPPVAHLLRQQVARNGVEPGVFILEVREDGQGHPRDARLAPTCPFSPYAVVDTAVGLEPSIEEQCAGLSRLPVDGWQTEVPEQQHCVMGRDPLWRVEPPVRRQPAGPGALGVLPGEQTGPPAVAPYFSPFTLDGPFCSPDHIPQGLPTNGRIPVEEPLDSLISRRSQSHSCTPSVLPSWLTGSRPKSTT